MKENSAEWRKKEQELKAHAIILADKLEFLKEEFSHHHTDVVLYMMKYPADAVEEMNWEDQQKVVGEADILFEKLRQSETKLNKLDEEYDALRKEVNAFYGREVMRSLPPSSNRNVVEINDNDPADWWKKQS